MTLVYYNAIADSIYVIESLEGAAMSMYYILNIRNKKHGWIFVGEL